DLVVPSLAIAQSIGRWGNFFNSEAHGGPTNLPWAIMVDGQAVHPTFLYESIWCFLLFFVLLAVDNKRKFEGQTFLLYGILYSFERFFVEALRTDSLMLGPFKQSQVLSLLIFVTFLIIYILKLKKIKQHSRLFY
ncbi:MAG: prolipoprotein diacylglyceryl transferase, partial [Anaerovorax sp.]